MTGVISEIKAKVRAHQKQVVPRKPRTQRKVRYNAPMHKRRKFLGVHISEDLRRSLNIKTRSIVVRKGDRVKIHSGEHKGKTGKVRRIDLKRCKIFIEGISITKSKGAEKLLPIDPSNVSIVEFYTKDKKRKLPAGVVKEVSKEEKTESVATPEAAKTPQVSRETKPIQEKASLAAQEQPKNNVKSEG
ncbi:MAG: 50S ribosomal protein L24 [Candidatus Micrarchaeia archaeon]